MTQATPIGRTNAKVLAYLLQPKMTSPGRKWSVIDDASTSQDHNRGNPLNSVGAQILESSQAEATAHYLHPNVILCGQVSFPRRPGAQL